MKTLPALLLIMISGCARQSGQQGYVAYINNPAHKILQQIEVGQVQTTVKWLPAAYRNLGKEMSGADEPDNDAAGLCFFDVRFDKTKGEKPEKEKLQYLDFDIQKDFVLLEGKDSILPVICQKIENGIGGSYQYLLAFEKTGRDLQDFSVIYNDKVFGIGTLAFVYTQQDIQKIPLLKEGESE